MGDNLINPELRNTRQKQIFKWCKSCFGKGAINHKERVLRFLEESLELAQSLKLEKTDVLKLVDYVYARPLGVPTQEVGGVQIGLLALCEFLNISAQEAENEEFTRILTVNPQHFIDKQNAKNKEGVTGC